MDKNGSLILLFVLLLIVFAPSHAFNSRILASISDPNGTQDSELSSPPPPDKTGDSSTVGAPKPKDKTVTNASDSGDTKLDAGKNEVKGSKTFASESCKGNPVCNDQGKTIMACVQDFGKDGSKNLTLIVQNEQDINLKVNITYGTSIVQTYELPGHATEKVNITFSGDKSNKVILNAGIGDCELQISQPSLVNSPSKPSPSKPKDPENTSNVTDVKNPVDSPAKPKDVNNTADTPAKPKDVQDATDTPAKPNDVKNPANSPTKPKEMDTTAKTKNENDPAKSKVIHAPLKSKDGDDLSKAKDTDDHSNSKEAGDPTKSNSEDVDASTKPTPISFDAPVSKNNVFDQFTFYSKQVTPMHGAYLAFLVALVIGGTWALCSIRKRRTGGGVPYQELEMGPSESSHAVDVEAAEGWDQDWDDDDWDEDKAIRSPGGSNHAKTISSNGLTSRATKKDDWDANWDD